ncbi:MULTISPECIES: DUF6578 domain-containing protein [unclassified Streptomyces]|uniref:DUF6578 domain-containing protein n=1 Tax=unclassified Streptomyces TaxID=2593676 RepID=UPI002366D5E8|nr:MULTISPECIES: DUF6578 domain-containing protein [unclassified Streptomyces]MDF3148227.1 hypothetical protein [Streptomyces sp. T21Q-yed]WDF37612.1 hypothetical protein PBV52_12760 [Streptomyces sp. T12]
MGLWHVFYADWQMECCGKPFKVGDEVSWPLLLQSSDDALGGGWHDQLTKVTGPVEEGTVRVLREESGLVVALHRHPVDMVAKEDLGGVRPGDRLRVVGLLTAEFHGDPHLPETRGRVRAIQVLRQGYAEMAPGSLTREPVPGDRSLRSVWKCPKWFADADAGVLVTLEVPGTDSWLSHAVREARGLPHEGTAPGAEVTGLAPAALAELLQTLSTVPKRG